ncbi:MAG: LCP family protein [Clostridia bacterium]|nr:LCP family protein [Clostridia bacterium]
MPTSQTPSSVTFLLLGVDSAACNSDVVVLGRYESRENNLTLMQLPRDMYIEGADDTPKLNHIYAACRANGMADREALAYTVNTISEAFPIRIDVAACLDLSTFGALVDAVGGVPITVPFDMSYEDPYQGLSIVLRKGDTVLDGKTAEQFVRYRSGYIEGDLGRLDAQKIFFAACLQHVIKNMTVMDMLSLFIQYSDQLCFLGDRSQLLSIASEVLAARKTLSTQFLSIPGEAICADNGVWYYIINRDATCEVMNRFFAPSVPFDKNTFDPQGRFYRENTNISNIYFSATMPYRVYTAEEITDINILKKD